MKKISQIFALILIIVSSLSFSARVLAADAPKLDYSGFVKCDGVVGKNIDRSTGKDLGAKQGEEERQRVCDFRALMDTILGLVNWMYVISVSVATVIFAYGGLLYLSGKEKNITQAKKIFTAVAIGFIIMLTAWISIRTVIDWFVEKDSGATTFIQ